MPEEFPPKERGEASAVMFPDDINLATVMNTVLDGLIIIDGSANIKAFNQAAIKIFGYTAEEVLGKNVKLLMPEPYKSEHDSYVGNYIHTHEPKVIGKGREVSGKRKNGEIFPMELGVNELRMDKQVMFVGMVRDISDKKKAESERESYIQALQQSNRELDDFAYIASHDIKEPLRGLSNNATFLKEDFKNRLSEEAINRVDRIIFLSERMEKLINDLLYFAGLGKKELAVQETDLNEIVNDVLSTLDSLIVDKNVNIDITSPLPSIICDHVGITEVFRNLIVNAIKYNDKPEKNITIGSINNSIIYIKDNGIGIDGKFHNDIFRIFKRLNYEDDDDRGTGVGLTFVKKIIENHSGSIWLESTPGEGTTFFFKIA